MNFKREVSSFTLPPGLISRLLACGYRYAQDFEVGIRPIELAKELGCTNQEALEILRTIQSPPLPPKGKSAFDLLNQENQTYPIVTFNHALDQLLGGGIPLGKITEFCGVPGVGKTQMGMQLAVDVHIPQHLGGTDGHCIYIDTEGSFVPERAREMADHLVYHLIETLEASGENPETSFIPSADQILENIYYYRLHDYVEQLALVNVLPNLLRQNPKVRLIVFDSITFHFRHDFENMSQRTRLLNGMAQTLLQIADQYSVAVVLINQVTTKFNDHISELVPALGESWGHNIPHRVMLYWKDGTRYAHLYKSTSQQEGTVPYQITQAGVRGLETDIQGENMEVSV